MNNNTKYNRLIVFLSLVLFIPQVANSQTRALQNVSRVIVTNQYLVENGIRKSEYFAIKQDSYDSLNRLHTEIEFDINDHYPHNFKWHAFNGLLKSKTETYLNEKLNKIEEFKYNSESLIKTKEIRTVTPSDTSLFLILNYTYNEQKKPVKVEARTPKGKIAYKVTSKYDNWGNEISRKVKTRNNYFPDDSIISLTRTIIYDSLNRISSEKIIEKNILKNNVEKNIFLLYDKTGNIVLKVEKNSLGAQINKEERIFHEKKNRLQQVKYYDSTDKLIKNIFFRYEIYKGKNREVREIDY